MRKGIEYVLKNCTSYQVAKDLGITNRTINRYQNGESPIENMSFGTAEKIYNYYLKLKEEEKEMLETTYFKNIHTGIVRTMAEWKEDDIKFFTEKYNEGDALADEFDTLEEYLEFCQERGYFYSDLVECDKDGNEVNYDEY